MRKSATNVAFLVATLLMIAGAIFWFKDSMSEKKTPEAKETAKPVVLMSTDGVKDNIERRLTRKAGRQVKADCPKKVDQAVGTTFACEVFFVGRKDAIAIADVKIDGPNGEFTWKSTSKVAAETASTETPS